MSEKELPEEDTEYEEMINKIVKGMKKLEEINEEIKKDNKKAKNPIDDETKSILLDLAEGLEEVYNGLKEFEEEYK